MDCIFKKSCGRDGKRSHLFTGSKQSEVEIIYLCDECRSKYQEAIKRISAMGLSKEEATHLLEQYRKGNYKMPEVENNKILIPLTSENQKYVEGVCSNGAYTFQTFFEHLLNLYKRSLNEPLSIPQENKPEEKKAQQEPKTKTKK
mgnify:CR=1 FL=1